LIQFFRFNLRQKAFDFDQQLTTLIQNIEPQIKAEEAD
jgi:hypothetical protein